MRIVYERPPLFSLIDAAFGIAGKPVVFAFGDAIYNPERIEITPELHAHEAVHGERQAAGPETWWRSYIADARFRLFEELPAHFAEYHAWCANHPELGRTGRRLALAHIARRLSSPLYGGLVSYEVARKLIKTSADQSAELIARRGTGPTDSRPPGHLH